MSSSVVVIPPEILVEQALTLMRLRGVHSLVVDLSADDGHRYGIVTTTDIRDKISALGLSPAVVRVSDIMTSPIQCAHPGWSVYEAAQAMLDLGIDHLPVEDKRATIVGVISATDVFIAVEEVGWTEIS
jgi:CBS domain-containing protein